jgi:hypothetical protein
VWIIKSPENLELPFNFLEDAILADLLLVEDLDGYLVPRLLMESHYTKLDLKRCYTYSLPFRMNHFPGSWRTDIDRF